MKCHFPPHIDSVSIVTCTGLKDKDMENIGLLPWKFRERLPEMFLKAGRMYTTLTKVMNYIGHISFPDVPSAVQSAPCSVYNIQPSSGILNSFNGKTRLIPTMSPASIIRALAVVHNYQHQFYRPLTLGVPTALTQHQSWN